MLINFLFPPACPVCDRPLPIEYKGRCHEACQTKIKLISGATCFKCGRPLINDTDEFCELCRSTSYHYDGGYAVFVYGGIAKRIILDLKYSGRRDLAEFLINCAIERFGIQLEALHADAIIPVPIHKNRLKERGYNQAEVLGRELGKRLGIDCFDNILIRTKETKAQKQLGNVQRMMNLIDAFSVDIDELKRMTEYHKLDRVILIDDIFTTGSTAECCTLLLKSIGIKKVYLLNMCVADMSE